MKYISRNLFSSVFINSHGNVASSKYFWKDRFCPKHPPFVPCIPSLLPPPFSWCPPFSPFRLLRNIKDRCVISRYFSRFLPFQDSRPAPFVPCFLYPSPPPIRPGSQPFRSPQIPKPYGLKEPGKFSFLCQYLFLRDHVLVSEMSELIS